MDLRRVVCVACGGLRTRTSRRMCDTCRNAHEIAVQAANKEVSRAVRKGSLPKASTQRCVDCGAQALDWEHRDYSKPLAVEPVCRSCNVKRGPALVWEAARPEAAKARA